MICVFNVSSLLTALAKMYLQAQKLTKTINRKQHWRRLAYNKSRERTQNLVSREKTTRSKVQIEINLATAEKEHKVFLKMH